jgi:hypothetical protein
MGRGKMWQDGIKRQGIVECISSKKADRPPIKRDSLRFAAVPFWGLSWPSGTGSFTSPQSSPLKVREIKEGVLHRKREIRAGFF